MSASPLLQNQKQNLHLLLVSASLLNQKCSRPLVAKAERYLSAK